MADEIENAIRQNAVGPQSAGTAGPQVQTGHVAQTPTFVLFLHESILMAVARFHMSLTIPAGTGTMPGLCR